MQLFDLLDRPVDVLFLTPSHVVLLALLVASLS